MDKFYGIAISAITSLNLVLAGNAGATSVQSGASAAQGPSVPTELFGEGGTITTITNAMLFIVGALSVIMIIYGGLRYIISGGNSNSVTAAKNTILYAIVGLIIAFLAFAIVNFVLGTLDGSSGTNR